MSEHIQTRARVSAIRCDSYRRDEVDARVAEAVEAVGGFRSYVQKGDRVLVKPNLLVGRTPEKVVNTNPEVVRAVIRVCLEAGAEVWVGDSPAFGNPRKAAVDAGILPVCEEMGVPFVPFTEAVETPCPDGAVAKRFHLAREVVEADKIISVAKMKTHGLTLYTAAVKNLYGTIVGTQKARLHLSYQSGPEFSRMLLDLHRLVHPTLSIVDAVVGMEGAGPQSGSPRKVGLILAGADALAVDTVGAAIVGLSSRQVPYLAAATEESGITDLNRIDLIGVPLSEAIVPGYKLPESAKTSLVPPWIAGIARNWVTSKPVVLPDQCIGCGICRDGCPAQAISIQQRVAAIDYKQCIRCFCCQELCPQAAIELRGSTLGRLFHWE